MRMRGDTRPLHHHRLDLLAGAFHRHHPAPFHNQKREPKNVTAVTTRLYVLRSWNRIVAAPAPRVAARDAAHCEPGTFQRAVLADRLVGIMRAARRIDAARRRQWRDE